jgi:hypothetical protein
MSLRIYIYRVVNLEEVSAFSLLLQVFGELKFLLSPFQLKKCLFFNLKQRLKWQLDSNQECQLQL